MATAASAREALTHCSAAHKHFPRVVAQTPEGEEIDELELNRRALLEEADV